MELCRETSMLTDVQYVRASKSQGQEDYLYYVWKDLDTGEKYLGKIPQFKIPLYYTKPEFRDYDYPQEFKEINKCDKRFVRYRHVLSDIARDIGPSGKRFLSNCFNTKEYKKLNDLYKYPYVFGADIDPRAYFMVEWNNKLKNDREKPVTRAFLDIECDTIEIVGMKDVATCPIDLITVIDGDNKVSHTFCLMGRSYPEKDLRFATEDRIEKENTKREMYANRAIQEAEFVKNLDNFKAMLHDTFDENYGSFDYRFYFFTDELKLLESVFKLIHGLKKDNILVWNLGFDIPDIIERLERLGRNPLDVICHKDFPNKECWYKKDHRTSDPKERKDWFYCTSYSVWRDQMTDYASIRKGGKTLRSLRLTDIAKKEIGDTKLGYAEEGSLKNLAYMNYAKYVMYNIKDVLLQYGIEEKTEDLYTTYSYFSENACPHENVFKQTKILESLQYSAYLDQGFIPGNNINIGTSDDPEEENKSFEGAIVGDPLLIGRVGNVYDGKKTNNMFDLCIDMDMGSFYPSTVISHNITQSAMYFKVIIDPKQFKPAGGKLKVNTITDHPRLPTLISTFKGEDISKEVFDNLQTRDYLSFGHKWFNLPNITELFTKYKKKRSIMKYYEE